MSPQRLSRAVWVTWPRFLLKPSAKRLEAQPLLHVLEANGRNMSGARQDGAMTADSLSLNGTAALGLRDQEMNSALYGVLYCFNLTVLSPLSLRCLDVIFLSETAVFVSSTEFKVFNIVIIALALCILTITGLYCITVCYNRSR